MSFGWSAGDIVAGISTMVKVGKALKQSGGAASEYQGTVAFLTSVKTTLRGLEVIVTNNSDLTWKDELVEQAGLLKSAVDDFRKQVDKYDLSLGSESERRKARRIPKEIQFALSEKIKELRVAITQPQLVLDVFINLQTL
jgi:molecular chaperone DnaK (HSP70)